MSERKDHLAWCKQRALECLPGDPSQAIASMKSDLSKHEETRDAGAALAMLAMAALMDGSEREARRYIEGFN